MKRIVMALASLPLPLPLPLLAGVALVRPARETSLEAFNRHAFAFNQGLAERVDALRARMPEGPAIPPGLRAGSAQLLATWLAEPWPAATLAIAGRDASAITIRCMQPSAVALLRHPQALRDCAVVTIFDRGGAWDTAAAGLAVRALGTAGRWSPAGSAAWVLVAAFVVLFVALATSLFWRGMAALRASLAVLVRAALAACLAFAVAHVAAWSLHRMNLVALALALYGWQRWRSRRQSAPAAGSARRSHSGQRPIPGHGRAGAHPLTRRPGAGTGTRPQPHRP